MSTTHPRLGFTTISDSRPRWTSKNSRIRRLVFIRLPIYFEALEGVYRAYVEAVARAVVKALRRYGAYYRHHGFPQVADEAADLVQEVIIRAFEPKTRHRFDGSRRYAPYLTQITRNVVVDHLRIRWRRVAVEADPFIDEISLHPPPGQGDDRLVDGRTLALVDRYLANLLGDLRRVHDAWYVRPATRNWPIG